MRDIRFRAWDKKDKLWVAGWSISQAGTQSEVGDRVYMQFTGLKDKNGVEIYEGDILRYWHKPFYLKEEDDPIPRKVLKIVEWRSNRKNTGYALSPDAIWEVIGNIYENKELLK